MGRKKGKTSNDRDHVKNTIKAEVTQLLRDRVQQYRQQREKVAAYVERDPTAPARARQETRERVANEVQTLADMWGEVLSYVRNIKSSLGDILDHTRLVACYLLFGKVSQGLAAIFVLARDGFHYEVMEIVRSNREALDLIALFLTEPEDSALLRKWFDGEIIDNEKARRAVENHIKATAQKSGMSLSISDMKSGIYSTLSKFTHASYTALLEAYDVFRHDFDFERIGGYHYLLRTSLPYVRTEIHSSIIALKGFYSVVEDRESYVGLDALLRKYAPHLYDDEEMKKRTADILARFNKQ